MPASVAFFSDVLQRVRLGEGDGDAVDFLVDGLLDQLGLPPGFRIAGVQQFNVVLRRRFLGALADDVPERVTRRAWVIRATLMRGVEATWPPPAAAPESAGLPPVLEHALRASMGTTAATRVAFRHENLVTINLL